MTNALFPAEFRLDDVVRLLVRHDDVPGGAIGCVLGRFPHADGTATYAVSFVAAKVCVLELHPDEIVVAGIYASAA